MSKKLEFPRPIGISINTARILAKNKRNDIKLVNVIKSKLIDEKTVFEVIVDKAPYYILRYGKKVLDYAKFLPDSKLKKLLGWAGIGISWLAGYWHIKEK